MSSDSPEWFKIDDSYSDAEREFLQTMLARAQAWVTIGLSPDDVWLLDVERPLILCVDVCDPESKGGLRTLRVDFDGVSVIAGEDETGQMSTDLDITHPDVLFRHDVEGTPNFFATIAADWIEQELRRPIERHEWSGTYFRHCRWVLADTHTPLVWSDSSNEPRPELGEPHRIVVVRDFRKLDKV